MLLVAFTLFHVILSLVGIAAGFFVLYGLISSKHTGEGTAVFLTTTLATTLTGFLFPFHGFTPAIAVGIFSLILLAIAIPALYLFHLRNGWRLTYVIAAMLSLYLNVFVLVAQLFQKVPALHALAPTGSEPPFQISQLTVLLAFIVLTVQAARRFRADPLPAA